ncbi:MAG: cysteine--tRNA ligase [Candidatus Peribacteraceae bacterium]|nr:cysteine--tRNA ligase [Candidatus Peribacteraceae bacterium]
MALRLYNTLSKREEDFCPLRREVVTMYTCGPTVYGRPHIGNYSSYLMADLVRRWLEAGHGYTVKHVKNITDVGHLVADADTGEDKVEKEAKRIAEEKRGQGAVVTMEDVLAVAEMYTEQFIDDERALKILEATERPRASRYVPQMITMIEALIAKGHAYETDDGVYFDVGTFKDYGQLSGNTLDKLNAGARVAVDEQKKHPADFALWKKCVGSNASHVLRWASPWGEGFPGWHIECSAMSSALLGEQIDLHTGGEDNIFPHHECEIAQSECSSHKKPFVRHWLHKRHIDLAGGKMSKSLGNVIGIPDIRAKGYSPMDLRYLLLSVHYRTNLKFTFDSLDSARKVRLKIVEWISELRARSSKTVPRPATGEPPSSGHLERFTEAMNSDLNTPAALAEIFGAMNAYYAACEKGLFFKEDAREFLTFVDLIERTLGCFAPETFIVPANVQALLDERASARATKDFKASDRLRDEIKALGYEVRDEGKEQKVRRM